MNISEMIKNLEKMKNKYGDIGVDIGLQDEYGGNVNLGWGKIEIRYEDYDKQADERIEILGLYGYGSGNND